MKKSYNPVFKASVPPSSPIPGLYRRSLTYNAEMLLCHFTMDAGVEIPLHQHKEAQIGYLLQGSVRFYTEKAEFLVSAGGSYVFDAFEKHGARFLEATELIEVFSPRRDEYLDLKE